MKLKVWEHMGHYVIAESESEATSFLLPELARLGEKPEDKIEWEALEDDFEFGLDDDLDSKTCAELCAEHGKGYFASGVDDMTDEEYLYQTSHDVAKMIHEESLEAERCGIDNPPYMAACGFLHGVVTFMIGSGFSLEEVASLLGDSEAHIRKTAAKAPKSN